MKSTVKLPKIRQAYKQLKLAKEVAIIYRAARLSIEPIRKQFDFGEREDLTYFTQKLHQSICIIK